MRAAERAGVADWLVNAARAGRLPLGRPIPDRFDAYARILHPLPRTYGPPDRLVTWAEVATVTGEPFTRTGEWADLIEKYDQLPESLQLGEWHGSPARGGLPDPSARVLADRLSEHSTSSTWWFAVWDGWPHLATWLSDAPLLQMPGRAMHLLCGTAEDAAADLAEPTSLAPYCGANLWWPDDHAWVVSSDVDDVVTFVGASRAAVSSLLAEPRLECVEVTYADIRVGGADPG